MTVRPLAIDLYCGLGGWAEGLLAEGWDVVGFDIERHEYGEHRYPAQLVIQDVMTLHGSQFRGASLIVASPPCQAYSYRAMPWKRAKALPPPDNTLFDACFRIQREACAAAGRHIPLIVENVRGAQKWVGRARWNFGSYYLWGDVPALMPFTARNGIGMKVGDRNLARASNGRQWSPHWTEERKVAGISFNGPKAVGFNVTAAQRYRAGLTETREGVKHCGSGAVWFDTEPASQSSRSDSRKAASAMIAKIPLPLSLHIGQTFWP